LRSRDPYISFALAISCCRISSVALLASSSDAFWVALAPVVCLFSSQSRLFGLTGWLKNCLVLGHLGRQHWLARIVWFGALIIDRIVRLGEIKAETGFTSSKVFLPSCQIEGPGLKLGGSFFVSLAVSGVGTLTGALIVTGGDFEGFVGRGIDAEEATAAVTGRAASRGWRLFGYLLLSSFESLEEGSFNLRRSDGRRDFSLMRCTVLSFRPLTVAIMKLDEVCAKVFSSWAWASRAFVFSSSCLATSSLPVAVFISAGAADQVLPWRARFPDPRSAFEWRHHFFSLTLCKVCISVCQSLSLVLQVLLQLSELSCQILVSLFSSRSCRSCSTSDRAAASSAINLSFSFLATASLSTAAFRAV
ncbi:hypothetical protein KCU75_g26, partial [Aureobasidium melanogenum]